MPRWAGAALLPLALLATAGLTTPAFADILVSNTGKDSVGDGVEVGVYLLEQSFNPGPNKSIYSLESIVLEFESVPTGDGELRVRVFVNDNTDGPTGTTPTRPWKLHASLSNPANFQVGPNTFTAPPRSVLSAHVPYWIVISYLGFDEIDTDLGPSRVGAEGGPVIAATNIAGGVDSTGRPGWVVGLPFKRRSTYIDNPPFTDEQQRVLKFQVRGNSGNRNTVPVFEMDSVVRSVAKGTPVGTKVGEPLPAATDADNDTLTYTFQSTDFDFDPDTRQLTTNSRSYGKSSHSLSLIVDDRISGQDLLQVTVNITDGDDDDDPPPDDDDNPPPTTTPPGGGGGGGGSANRPPVVERVIEDQVLDAGSTMELDIRLSFYDRDQNWLDYEIESADESVATAEAGRDAVLKITGHRRGMTAITVTALDRREESATQTFRVRVAGPAHVPLFPNAADPLREGFARIINHDAEGGDIAITAMDDRGNQAGPVTLGIGANRTVHFNSADLESGNPDKGLAEGVGQGEGAWRLTLQSDLDFEVLAYIRTPDGFLTAMHDTVASADGVYRVPFFNPGSNVNQVSSLRLVNPGERTTAVAIDGTDDTGTSPGDTVAVDIAPGNSATVTSSELETEGLGDGRGKWRLALTADDPIVAMSLLESPEGHLTNLSTVPRENGRHIVPLFPSAADPLGRQGFVRVVNRSARAGEVSIAAQDDSDVAYETLTLALDGGAAAHFNSNDLELGNAGKGLTGSTGAGASDWRLELTSELDIGVYAYIRTNDGFLTAMHDVTPSAAGRHWVAILNPGSNPNQASHLRLVNPGGEPAAVTITGADDSGRAPGAGIDLILPSGASMTLSAKDLESGDGLQGALGDGTGKWRLSVASDKPILVMSLLASPTGHLTNLSTAPDRGPYE